MRRPLVAAIFGLLLAALAVAGGERHQRGHELGSMRVLFDPPGLKYVLSETSADEDRGWREDRLVPRPLDGMVRLVCMGDSVTFGVNVGAHETWCAQVRRGLGCRAEAINFGMNGYDAEQVATLLETRVAAWKPDVVLWGAYMNDQFPTYLLYGQTHGRPVFVGSTVPEQARFLPEGLSLFLVRQSALFRGIQGAVYARSETRAGPREPASDWYATQVGRIAAWSRSTGVPLAVLAMGPHALANPATCPAQFPVAGLCEASLAQYQAMTAELTRQGLPYVDGLAAYQASGQPHFHPPGRLDPDHPNAAGHRALAGAMTPAVRAALGGKGEPQGEPEGEPEGQPAGVGIEGPQERLERDPAGARVQGGGRRRGGRKLQEE